MAQDTLTNLVKQLSVQSAHNEHYRVEKTCQELLQNGCDNANKVVKDLIVALIKQDKYQQAQNALNNYSHIVEKYEKQFRLEKLYIFYKLNNNYKFDKYYKTIIVDDIDTILDKNEKQTSTLRALLHLRAQFCYKTGQLQEAYKIYRYLNCNNSQEMDNVTELAINERVPLTVDPSLHDTYPMVSQINYESYDLLFNESMILSTRGEFDQSIELLKQVLTMAQNEGYENDMNSIKLQLAYVYQISKKNDKLSKEILNELVDQLPHDSPFYLMAKSNLLSFTDLSKYSTNFNLTLRELNYEKFHSLNTKFFTMTQWNTILQNFMLLKLFNNVKIKSGNNNQNDIFSKTLKIYSIEINDIVLQPYRVQAKKLYKRCLSMIEDNTNNNNDSKKIFGLLLLTIQISSVEKQYQNCITLIEKYLNKLDFIAKEITDEIVILIYILSQLYDITNRSKSNLQLLDKLSHAQCQDMEFWKFVSFRFLAVGQYDDSIKIIQSKINDSYKSNDSLIQIVMNPEDDTISQAQELTKDIDLDVDKIYDLKTIPFENSISTKTQYKLNSVSKITKKRMAKLKLKRKEQKLNKYLMKHNLTKETATAPDPERWLPLRDRSTYRPKKRQLAKQTQGGSMNKKAEQSLDITKKNVSKKKGKGKGRR